MTQGRKEELGGGEYDLTEVCARIEERRRALGLRVAYLCKGLGIHHYDYSRKIRRQGSEWRPDEIAVLAYLLKARIGWPWISDEMLDLIEEAGGPPLPLVKEPPGVAERLAAPDPPDTP